jgi:glycosyltransferase involved in cell wall biosynthesis
MKVGTVTATSASEVWVTKPAPGVSVIVATHDRVAFLAGLFEALEAQTAAIEVVIADDGSSDGTWARLETITTTTALPVLALRLEATGGPSVPRNTAAAHARGRLLAVTDDDCLPEPDWAAELERALESGAWIAQGRTLPVDDDHGPWDRTVRIIGPTALYETCNLGLVRRNFVELDGFPTFALLSDLPRGFGEDVVLGARAAREGGFAWAGDAVVRHRWIRTSYREHLDGVRRLAGFPWLAREVPEVADRLRGGVFLSRRTMEYDAALGSAALAMLTRRPMLLLGAGPWVRGRLRSARARRGPGTGRPVVVRLAQEAAADTVGFVSLVRGSIRHRRPVL